MTNQTARLYAFAIAVLVLFLTWATVAAHPWAPSRTATVDPRVKALVIREQRLRHEALLARQIVARRWHTYHVQLAARRTQIASAQRQHVRDVAAARAAAATQPAPSSSPTVRVVSLPPLTITRTS